MTGEVLLYAHRLGAAAPTGIGRYVAELSTALFAETDDLRFAVCSTEERVTPAWVPPGLEVRRVPGQRQAIQLSWALVARPLLERKVPAGDLVHFLSPAIPVPTRRPVVCTVHDLMPITHGHWFTAKERWLATSAIHRMVDQAERIITDSAHVAGEVVEHLGVDRARIDVVHCGVSGSFAVDAGGEEAPGPGVHDRYGVTPGHYFIHVGSIDRRKNLRPVLQGLARMAETRARPPLLMVGPRGHGAEEVDAEIERLGLTEAVRQTGFVPDGELAVLVRGALALVHPSSFEGFGLTPLEAMAAGTPTAVSGHGAVREVVGDAALVVGDDDADAWAHALVRLLTDEGQRAELSRRGLDRAAGFTWSNAARATIAVYRQVLASGR